MSGESGLGGDFGDIMHDNKEGVGWREEESTKVRGTGGGGGRFVTEKQGGCSSNE